MKECLVNYVMSDEEVELACDIYKRYFSDSREELEDFFRKHKFLKDANNPLSTTYKNRKDYIHRMTGERRDIKVLVDCDHLRRMCGIDVGHMADMLKYFNLMDFKVEKFARRAPEDKEFSIEEMRKAQLVSIKDEYDKWKQELAETVHSRKWYEEKDDDYYSNNYTEQIERCYASESRLSQDIEEIEKEKYIEKDRPVQHIKEYVYDLLQKKVELPKAKDERNRDER